MKEIIFLTEIYPFPTHGGKEIRSFGLLKLLADLGYKLHIVVLNIKDSDTTNSDFLSNHKIYEIKRKKRKILKAIRYYFLPRRDVIKLIDKIIKEKAIDFAFIDYRFLGQYIMPIRKRGVSVIYGTHNAQAFLELMEPCNKLKQCIKKLFLDLYRRLHERIFFNKCNALIVVSEEDRIYHEKFVENKKIYLLPNFVELENSDCRRDNYIIITASFCAYQNLEGLKWFLKDVWNAELSNKTRLLLVGRGSNETLKALSDSGYYCENVNALGEVDHVKIFL